MTMLQLYQERTDWHPGGVMPIFPQATTSETDLGAATNILTPRSILTPLVITLGVTVSSFNSPLMADLTHQGTAPPAIRWAVEDSASSGNQVAGPTQIQHLCQELRQISGLTNEEIAQLLGVSRRSFQAWLAGDPISARKEARLRAIVGAIKQMEAEDRVKTRSRLLQRDKYSVSALDLLSEGRFDAAVDLALGQRRSFSSAARQLTTESLAVQFDRDQGNIPRSGVRLNRRLSKSIGR